MSQPGPHTTTLLQLSAQGDSNGILYCARALRNITEEERVAITPRTSIT